MTLAHKLTAAAAIVLLVLLVVGGIAWRQDHKALSQSKAVESAQKPIIAQATADKVVTTSDLTKALAAIQQQRTVVVTVPQAAAAIAQAIPNLPQQVQVQNVPATATTPESQSLVIPQADIPAFQKYKLDCDESNAKLLACAKNAVDDKTILTATEKERDSWKQTAQGGTFWTRLGSGLKHSGCGAAGGLVGVETAQSRNATPMTGITAGAATFGGCEVLSYFLGRRHK
jgi:hypothetical protein